MTDTPALSSEAREAIRQRAEQATKGPWRIEYDSDCAEFGPVVEFPYSIRGPRNIGADDLGTEYGRRYGFRVSEISELGDADAQFLAHAREDIPALLAEVERLQKAIDDALTFHQTTHIHAILRRARAAEDGQP